MHLHELTPDPAVQMVDADEFRALRLAVSYALQQGLATDDVDKAEVSNRSLISVAQKLGVVARWRQSCDPRDVPHHDLPPAQERHGDAR